MPYSVMAIAALVGSALPVLADSAVISTDTATLTVLHAFHRSEGDSPVGRVLTAPDGNLYGVNESGGKHDRGTVWRLSPGGALTVLHVFGDAAHDGSGPMAGVTFGADGLLYGTTPSGGAHQHGVVYRLGTDGAAYEVVHAFARGFKQGSFASAELLLHSDGNLYGTTALGGDLTCASDGCGTVFRIGPDGVFQLIHAFAAAEGALPSGGLAELPDGRMAGMMGFDGIVNKDCAGGCGSLYTITTTGDLSVAHLFNGTDGKQPLGTPVVGLDGSSLFGATRYGGKADDGVEFHVDLAGSFQVDTTFDCKTGPCTPSQGLSPAPGRYTSTDSVGHDGIVNHNGVGLYDGLVATGPLTVGADGALFGNSFSGSRKGFVFRLQPQE